LCTRYTDIFGLETESITTNNFYKQKLRVKDDAPVYIKNYRSPHSQVQEIQSQVQKLIDDKIVEPSTSAYNSPLLLVPKKSLPDSDKKKWRLVIDYRQINKKLLSDKFPLPRIDDILDQLENLVADALSRQQLNVLGEEEAFSSAATIHSELSLTHTIKTTDKPLNCFQNQITVEEARFPSKRSFVLFGNKRRHSIDFTCKESLLEELADIIVPKGVNAIHCDLHSLAMIQDELVRQFPATKFWHC
ncbi:hypothetical protein KR200_007314, partial [Drosophila serrata]